MCFVGGVCSPSLAKPTHISVSIVACACSSAGCVLRLAIACRPSNIQNPKRGQFTLTRDNNKKWSGLAGSKNTKYQLTTDVSVWTVATDGKHVFGRSDACDALTAQKP